MAVCFGIWGWPINVLTNINPEPAQLMLTVEFCVQLTSPKSLIKIFVKFQLKRS